MQFFRDMADNPFLLTGLLAGLLASVACGVIGPYVITRRIVFLSGAIAHVAVGGIGAAVFLRHWAPDGFAWLSPMAGATVAALGAAVVIGLFHEFAAERLDTLIGAFWAVGMAVGILLIKFTPGYQTELMSYLFGNIVYVSWAQIWWMIALNVVIVGVVLVSHKRLLALCLDPQQAELQGINVVATNITLLCLVALTVICLTQVVGLILVIALLCLPAATASHHLARLATIIWGSIGLCMVVTTVPRVAVYGTRVSAEAAIVLAAAGVYLASVLLTRFLTRTAARQGRPEA
ncbi:MAG: metal ABC transporter permease [Planctomycetes bacterium]|nr:metal ABC transporter permease [Planctomycetota bacterium]